MFTAATLSYHNHTTFQVTNPGQLSEYVYCGGTLVSQPYHIPGDQSRSVARVCYSGKQQAAYDLSHVMRKPALCICENKGAYQLPSNCAADQRLLKQSLFFLNPKFQASSHLMCLYSPVCVGPVRKPRRQVFLRRGSFITRHICYFVTHGTPTRDILF